MQAVHPAPFHRATPSQFAAARDALLRDLPNLNAVQIAVRFMAWTALLHDGHSGLRLAPEDRVFPVRIDRFVDGIFVVATRPVDARLLRGRVITIGELAATIAWDSVQALVSADNVYSGLASVPRLLSRPDILTALGLADDGGLPLVVVTATGDTVRTRLAAVTRNDAGGRPLPMPGWAGPGGATQVALGRGAGAGLVERHRGAAYWYTVRDRMLYAQINEVGNEADTVELGDSHAVVSLAGFTDSVMARIDRGGIEQLVLDLRFNGGGNNGLVRPFVAAVGARAIGTTPGRFFVVTGRSTYSAAMNFVSLLEDRTAALFVGEPPGGAPRHYGDAVPIVLPRSRLTLRLSTLEWDLGVGPRDIREVHEPDIPAPPRFADLVRGMDPPLEAIAAYRDGSLLADALIARYQLTGLQDVIAAFDSLQDASPLRGTLWGGQVQQLLQFADAVIPRARSNDDIFAAFALVTNRYPDSPIAWSERARVLAFVNDWAAVRDAYQRALALRPANTSLQRWLAMAQRR